MSKKKKDVLENTNDIKAVVIKKFTDKFTNIKYEVNDEIIVSNERYEELKNKKIVK